MSLTPDALRAAMLKRFEAMSMREWCRLTGCNVTHVSEFVRGDREGPPHDLLRALNLEVRYVRKRLDVHRNTGLGNTERNG